MFFGNGFVRWVLLTVFSAVGVGFAVCPVGDLNGDCQVDLQDLALFAGQWLEMPDCTTLPCADLDGADGVNLADLAILSRNWGLKAYPILINEYMSSNHATIEDPDNPKEYPDWIELYNFGSKAVDVGGCWLSDNPMIAQKFQIPTGFPAKTTVPDGGFLLLWLDRHLSQGPTHLDFKLSATTSEFVGLSDPSGNPIDSLDTIPLAADISYGRKLDGAAEWQMFGPSTQTSPTPGTSNGSIEDDGKVMISEIMYHPYNAAHPLAEDIREEYFELYNSGIRPVRLGGWRVTRGVEFTFPEVTIQPKAYLVVAADMATFQVKYPAVSNVVGGWIGHLSNSGETIEVVNTLGRVIDSVPYSDEGDWSSRLLGPVDLNHRGWEWSDLTDGQGHSLELRNPAMPNEYGKNWGPSQAVGGTPGQPNSDASENIPPLILNIKHVPVIPRPTDPVTVTARILDEQASGLTVSLHYRVDTSTYQGAGVYPTYNAASYTLVPMFDDGAHGDGLANDGVYAGQIPAMPNKTIVEFFVQAIDSTALSRTWPAPASIDGVAQQVTNLLYQVDQSFDPAAVWTAGQQPIYYLIMTEMERARLLDIGTTGTINGPNSQMNATFISIDGAGTELRYNLGLRIRGHGTRLDPPHQYHMHFPNDRPWKGVNAANLNSNFPAVYDIGAAAFEMAGIAQPDTYSVRVRVNGQDLALGDMGRTFGSYALVDNVDSDWVAKRFPNDSAGNAYKCMRIDGGGNANLAYLGTDSLSYQGPPPLAPQYSKQTNGSLDDWSDLINLTYALSTNTPDSQYVEAVNRVVNVEEWLRFIAVNTLVDNRENSIGTGYGDEYFMYRGVNDPRFVLIQHDLEAMFGVGDESGPTIETSGLFRATSIPALNRLMKHPQFAPRYYWHLKNLIETVFSAEKIGPLIDQRLGSWVPLGTRNTMKSRSAAINAYVLSKIPQTISVTTAVDATTKYVHTTTNTVSLSGLANAIDTRRVTVNGQPAVWTAWQASWTIASVPLLSGVNRVVIQAFDAADKEIDRSSVDVWYNNGLTTPKAGGTLAADETWTPTASPYEVTGTITIPAGRTLTIQPGTTIFMGAGASFSVAGKLVAQGTPYQRIRVTHRPGTSNRWNGFSFSNARLANTIAFTDIEYAGGSGSSQVISINNSQLLFDRSTVFNNGVKHFDIHYPQVTIRHSSFSDVGSNYGTTAEGINADGWFIVDGNIFGKNTGDNDIFHLNGISRKGGPVAQILNNVFTGAGDDIIDDNETDTHIEGNLFMRANKGNTGHGASAAITTGPYTYDYQNPYSHYNMYTQHLMIVRNVFFENDAAILNKTDAFSAVYNNVFIGNRSAILYDEAYRPLSDTCWPGRAVYVENSIFWNNGVEDDNNYSGSFVLVTPLDPLRYAPGHSQLTVNNSIVKSQFFHYGTGNLDVEPGLVNPTTTFDLSSAMPQFSVGFDGYDAATYIPAGGVPDVRLLLDSPARGTGLNGVDMGAFVSSDASISGTPSSPTWKTDAALSVAGTDVYGYKYRVIGPGFDGSWSPEIAREMPATGISRSGNVATLTVTGHGFSDGDIVEVIGADAEQYNGLFPIYNVTVNTFSYTLSAQVDVRFPTLLDIWVRKPETIRLSNLTDGTYAVEVIKKNSMGVWQDQAKPTTAAWTVDTAFRRLSVNEVLARNAGTLPINGSYPNLVELYYDAPATELLELGGMKVVDGGSTANEYVLPVGTKIAGGEYLVLYADWDIAAPGIHLGYALNGEGDAVKLYNASGELIDSVEFGFQAVGLSIGRIGSDPRWVLCKPTFGQPNVAQPFRNDSRMKINEWLADGQVRFSDDFIELYNPDNLPVKLDGLHLTDNVYSEPTKYTMPPLSFVGANDYIALWSKAGVNANNLNFRLRSEFDRIMLLDQDMTLIDGVMYSDQTTDYSQGRTPDGADPLSFFKIPTPGTANPKGATITYTTSTLIPENAAKKVLVPTAAVAEAWKGGAAFNDGAWNSGAIISGKAGGVGYENNPGDAVNYTDLITYDIKSVRTGTVYIRVPFTLTADQIASISSMNLKMRRDDGFIAYINGVTAAQTDNVPATPAWNSYTTTGGPADSTARQLADYSITNASVLSSLKVGQNILAVHGMDTTNSSDMIISFVLEIITKHSEGGANTMAPYEALADGLRITELMYAPAAGGVEYVELKNVGSQILDLKNVRFMDGITYEFGNRSLNPGQFVVVTADVAAFQALYGTGIPVVGPYVGALKDRGEALVLALPDPYIAAILRFTYQGDWYPLASGGGHSLVIVNDQLPAEAWDHAESWRASTQVGGSPGADDPQ
jgi:hypothetical protein